MNRAARLEAILRTYGGAATLGEIIRTAESRGDRALLHRLTNATSELRDDLEARTPMETLVWERGATPGKGLYTIFPAFMQDGVVTTKPRQLNFGVAA